MSREGILFLLVGPSGAGKNTLMKRVQQQIDDLPQLATATTRPIRPGEKEGREHQFVTPEKFRHLIDEDALVEHQAVHAGHLYGTPRKTIEDTIATGHNLIADVEPLGALKVFEAYPDNTVLIFVTPSNLDILKARIRQRGKVAPDVLAHRLARVPFEMTFAGKCHYILLNDWLNPASDHLYQIILSERAKRWGTPTSMQHTLTQPQLHSTVIVLLQHGNHLLIRLENDYPIFPMHTVVDLTASPHEIVQTFVNTLTPQATLDEIRDDRFDFPAPHDAAVATLPFDAYLYFYYKFSVPDRCPVREWEWHAISALKLPPAIEKLVRP